MPEQVEILPTDRVFVLTGAGISAESGLATFRASDGLWSGHRVEDVATPEAWATDPELVWRFYSQRRRDARAAEPNPAHKALAALEEKIGDGFLLVTQNVDDLHERAGSRRMIHMHGQLFESRCEDDCGEPVFADGALYESLSAIPRCGCGARIRPHIVWFGEMPLEMDRIQREIDRCTVLLVVGTS
jgi:NAD-dependent deacetylase